MDPTTQHNLLSVLEEYTFIPRKDIPLDALVISLGLDSLDLVQLTQEVDDHFLIDLPADAITHTTTVAQLGAAIEQAQSLL